MKLYVGNLPFKMDAEEIRSTFSQHGTVTDVHVVLDRHTGRPRGFAFVTMDSPTAGQSAIAALHDSDIGGRKLVVNEARPMEPRAPREGGYSGGGGGGGYRGGGGGGGGGYRGGGGDRPRRDSGRSSGGGGGGYRERRDPDDQYNR